MTTFKEGSVTGDQIKISQSHFHKKANEASYIKLKCKYTGTLSNNTSAEYIDYNDNTILTGKIKKIKELANDPNTDDKIYELTLFDLGYNLKEGNVNKIWDAGYTPEGIIEDIVEDNNLTFSNEFGSSGVTIENRKRYIDKDPIECINELCNTIGAVWRVESSTFYLYTLGEDTSTVEIDANNNWNTDGWEDDTSKQVNSVIVKGATIMQRTTESLSGTGTTFYTSRTPHDVQIEGLTQTTENIDGDYEVFKGDFDDGGVEKKGKIVFESSQTDPEVNYSYTSQIRIQAKRGSGDIFKEVQRKYIESSYEARKFARQYLDMYSDGISEAEWKYPNPNKYNINNIKPGDLIKVTNKLNSNRDGYYLINKIERRYPKEIKIRVGENENSLIDWQSEAKDRIKQLESQDSDSDYVQLDNYLVGDFEIVPSSEITKLFTVEETGEILFASEDALTNESDMIYDDGSEPEDYPLSVDDDGLSSFPNSYTDLLS
jgi:hypothetical protein